MIESHASEHGEVRGKELNESEPSDEASLAKIGHIKTKGQFCFWDNGRGNLFYRLLGVRRKGGKNLSQAL